MQAYLTVRANYGRVYFSGEYFEWIRVMGGLGVRRTIEGIMNSSNHLMCRFLLRTTSRSRLAADRTKCSREIRAFGTDNDMKDKTLYFHISPR